MISNRFAKQFETIQKDRRGVVLSSVYPGIKELVSEIYPEEAHFIYELLQNAEDAKASSVYFEIKKDMLVFRHNGTKLFDANDVDSITNIAKSTKKENYVQAGKFGIGFKSVYAFTDTPYIYCDSVCFRIDQLLLPVQIDDLEDRKIGWTEFHFPFDSPKINEEDAKKKIRQGLVEIESTTLLFLNNISELNYVLEDRSSYSVIKEKDGRIITCSVMKGKKIVQKDTWMRFSKDSTLNGQGIQVDIAFPMVYKDKKKVYDFVRGEDKVYIKFLAKNEKSNLRFFINAPFCCTPARDTVNKGDKANNALIKEIASLMQTTITELRDSNYLTDDFFEILPLEEDDIPEFYQPIVSAIKKSFSDRKNLPTMIEGQYVTVENGIMSRRDVIDKIFTQKDIRTVFQNNNLCFVKNRPLNTRAYKFLKSLEIKELSPDAVLVQMVNLGDRALIEWLKNRSNEKLTDLYGFLNKGIDNLERQAEKYEEYEDYVTDDWYRKNYASDEELRLGHLYLTLCEQIKKVKQVKIVRTYDGDFVMAADAYIVEKGIEVPPEFKVVQKDLYKKDTAEHFLKSMGVKSFTQEELQGYQYKNEISVMKAYLEEMQKIEVQRNAKPLDIARKILEFLKEHKHGEIEWNDYRIVYAKRSNKYPANWHRISDCCLDKPLISETGLNTAISVHKKYIVAEVYNELDKAEKKVWIDFLKRGGALWEIKVRYVIGGTGYDTGIETDYVITYIRQYLELHSISLARYIWKSLSSEGGWKDSYNTKYFKLNKKHSSIIEESSVLNALKNIKWVPDKNGIFRVPRDVSRDTIDTSFVIDETNGFLAAIGFGENAKKREEEEKARREKEFLEQEQQKEAAKRLGFDSTEDVLASKEDARKVAELRELGIDIDDVISAEKKKRREKERKNIDTMMLSRKDEVFREGRIFDYDVTAVVSNPERRKEKLEEDLWEEPGEAKRKVTVRKDMKPNEEEKQFLYNQYSGKCQVCSKRIVKKDGSYYFEAINLMDTSELEEKYLSGLNIGWNSLCLCPNCAVEYKYGAVSLYDFQEKVQELIIDRTVGEDIVFPIKMQGEERELRYSPVHLFSLQTALSYFRNISNRKEEDSSKEKVELKFEHDVGATEIKRLESGDRCPTCGTQNTYSSTITVIDRAGNSCKITGILCQCGTIYLTKKLYGKITDPGRLNIVKADSLLVISEPKKKQKAVVSTTKIVSKQGKIHIVVNKPNRKESGSVHRCRKCGAVGTVLSSDLCWSCYKEERQSMYE